jgi:hypothetical protein
MAIFPFNLFSRRSKAASRFGPTGDLDAFLQGLARIAEPVENLHFRFGEAENPTGFVQLWGSADHWVQIHRIWTRQPNNGDGTRIMQALCNLADEHDVGIRLKVLPIGRKPYPLPRLKLKQWYERFGFAGKGWKVRRLPAAKRQEVTISSNREHLLM